MLKQTHSALRNNKKFPAGAERFHLRLRRLHLSHARLFSFVVSVMMSSPSEEAADMVVARRPVAAVHNDRISDSLRLPPSHLAATAPQGAPPE